jgi:hypothetical protein
VVIKPHTPSIFDVSEWAGDFEGVPGLNSSLEGVDAKNHGVKMSIEGVV